MAFSTSLPFYPNPIHIRPALSKSDPYPTRYGPSWPINPKTDRFPAILSPSLIYWFVAASFGLGYPRGFSAGQTHPHGPTPPPPNSVPAPGVFRYDALPPMNPYPPISRSENAVEIYLQSVEPFHQCRIHEFYIGETVQPIADRFRQHFPSGKLADKDSSVAMHHTERHPEQEPNLEVVVLGRGGGFVRRKTLEGTLIQKKQPQINKLMKDSESREIDLFLD